MAASPRKKITFDPGSLHALRRLALDRGVTLQSLTDEAFRDLLRKYWRPVTLADALRDSARMQAAKDARLMRLQRKS